MKSKTYRAVDVNQVQPAHAERDIEARYPFLRVAGLLQRFVRRLLPIRYCDRTKFAHQTSDHDTEKLPSNATKIAEVKAIRLDTCRGVGQGAFRLLGTKFKLPFIRRHFPDHWQPPQDGSDGFCASMRELYPVFDTHSTRPAAER